MLYAKKTNLGFIVGNLFELFPDTSFPLSGPNQEWLDSNLTYTVQTSTEVDTSKFKIEDCVPYLENNTVYVFKVIPLTEQEKTLLETERLSLLASTIRKQREHLLTASDWTQLPDSSVDKALWATYRQELRDISKQETFPLAVIWPEKPE